jgi:hypothetical protein
MTKHTWIEVFRSSTSKTDQVHRWCCICGAYSIRFEKEDVIFEEYAQTFNDDCDLEVVRQIYES